MPRFARFFARSLIRATSCVKARLSAGMASRRAFSAGVRNVCQSGTVSLGDGLVVIDAQETLEIGVEPCGDRQRLLRCGVTLVAKRARALLHFAECAYTERLRVAFPYFSLLRHHQSPYSRNGLGGKHGAPVADEVSAEGFGAFRRGEAETVPLSTIIDEMDVEPLRLALRHDSGGTLAKVSGKAVEYVFHVNSPFRCPQYS